MTNKFNIGVDFGGVLSIHESKSTNVSGSEHRNTAITMPFAVDALKKLKKKGHNLYLVSFCGRSRAIETRTSMNVSESSKLFNALYFTKSRSYKNELCQFLGCHFMIDDNVHVLDNIKTHNDKIVTILFGEDKHLIHKCVKDWTDVLKIINETEYFDSITSSIDIEKCVHQEN